MDNALAGPVGHQLWPRSKRPNRLCGHQLWPTGRQGGSDPPLEITRPNFARPLPPTLLYILLCIGAGPARENFKWAALKTIFTVQDWNWICFYYHFLLSFFDSCLIARYCALSRVSLELKPDAAVSCWGLGPSPKARAQVRLVNQTISHISVHCFHAQRCIFTFMSSSEHDWV